MANVGSIASNNYDGQFSGDYGHSAAVGDLDECNGMLVDASFISTGPAALIQSIDQNGKVLHSHY